MSHVHICAPSPDLVEIQRHDCSNCERRTYFIVAHTPWYGTDHTCLRCGDQWSDGERRERPFVPGWRRHRKALARAQYRRFRRRSEP